MAVYYARKSGNVNATDVWSTTPTGTADNFFPSFTNQDILMANNFKITLNVNTTVKEVRADHAYGAADLAAGAFNLNNGVTLTADIYANNNNGCVTFSVASATIVGSVYGGTTGGSAWAAIMFTGTGTLTIVGNLYGGTTSQSSAVEVRGAGILNVIGNVYAGRGGNAHGIITNFVSGQTINVTGNAYGSLFGAQNGVVANTTCTVNLIGAAIGSIGSAGLRVTSAAGISPTVSVSLAKGGNYLNGAPGVVNQSSLVAVTVNAVEYGDEGASPTSGRIAFANTTSNSVLMFRENAAKKLLVDAANASLVPAASDVRLGVAYNAGNSTGTCVIPTSSNVLFGVPCDSGTGTGSLTPAILWNYLASNATVSGSMGERLSTCSTIASTSQQIANIIGN